MQYRISQFILDTDERVLLKEGDRTVVSNHDRIIEALTILAREHPQAVARATLLEALWPTKEVSDWALSRLIADTRRLFEENGEKDQILKTVHGVGFRLAVPVTVFTDAEPDEKAAVAVEPSRTLHRATIPGVALAFASFIALIIFFKPALFDTSDNTSATSDRDPRLELKGQRLEGNEKTEELPLSSGWATTNQLPIQYHDGVSFSPTASTQKLGYQYFGPVNLNNATILMDISVTPDYIGSGAWLQPYAIILFDNWRGEWNCLIENTALSTEVKTFECILDEPGAIFNIPPDESMRIGVQAMAEGPIAGTVTIHKVVVKHAPSFVDHDWAASGGLSVTYNGGVQYSPKDGGERLEFKYNGPENLQGATVIFTLETSQEYIESGASLQIFAQNTTTWWGEWNCPIPNSALSPVGFRVECRLDEPDETLKLKEGESLLIGVMSQMGEQGIQGTVKVKNVEIILP